MEETLHKFEISPSGAVLLDGEMVKGLKAYNLFHSAKNNDRAEIVLVMDVLIKKDNFR